MLNKNFKGMVVVIGGSGSGSSGKRTRTAERRRGGEEMGVKNGERKKNVGQN